MNTNKRKQIENVVNSNPTLNKVAEYLNKNYNIPKDQAYNKFIDFLEKEVHCIVDNNLCGVKCFEFDNQNKVFKNRTIFAECNYINW